MVVRRIVRIFAFTMVNRLLAGLMAVFFSLMAQCQILEPVRFTSQLKMLGNGEAEIVFSATIAQGWHVYATEMGANGPVSATFNGVKMEGVELQGKLEPRGDVVTKYDQMFGMDLRFFEQKAEFVQKIRFVRYDYVIDCFLEYGACSDTQCLPPSRVELKKRGKSTGIVEKQDISRVALQNEESANGKDLLKDALWQPVVEELKSYDDGSDGNTSLSWWFVFLQGLLGGFVALLTPCVWPIIPMTVSFFLKRNRQRSKAVWEAVLYGLSIVVIYVSVGVAVTMAFGASALNALATSAPINIFFCSLLIVFAASFFGAFDLVLPSSWSNKVDRKSETATGLLSIFLMAFTLVLVSFSCTGPIIGFLLVAVSVQGSIMAPTIGMLGFSVALAVAFALFAVFPSILKSVPKSGAWMNVVKVTLGFVELAFALKFFSVADLAYGWHLLDREVFLSLWIVLFALLGAYLLGWIRFSHDEESRRTNVPQFFLAVMSLAFAVYLIPGLWGAPLKAVSAFTPPMSTQDFNLQRVVTEPQYKDYEAGMAAAKTVGKPVMIDFTGYGCVNCRKMEAAVWSDADVAELLNEKYVLISLYVDDKTPLTQPLEVTENGQVRTLRTVGDKWSYLQRLKFGANAQPFYVLLDNEGRPLAGSRSYDEDVQAYIDFLNTGLQRYSTSNIKIGQLSH